MGQKVMRGKCSCRSSLWSFLRPPTSVDMGCDLSRYAGVTSSLGGKQRLLESDPPHVYKHTHTHTHILPSPLPRSPNDVLHEDVGVSVHHDSERLVPRLQHQVTHVEFTLLLGPVLQHRTSHDTSHDTPHDTSHDSLHDTPHDTSHDRSHDTPTTGCIWTDFCGGESSSFRLRLHNGQLKTLRFCKTKNQQTSSNTSVT